MPKPFESEPGSTYNPLVILSGGGAIRVAIDPNVPKFISVPLAKSMVSSLIAEDIPASSDPSFTARYILWGQVNILNSSVFEPESVEVRWSLSGLDDNTNFDLKYILSGERPGWLFLDKNPLAEIQFNMGGDVAKLLYTNNGLSQVSRKPVYEGSLSSRKSNRRTLPLKNQFLEDNPKIFISGIIGAFGTGNDYLYSGLRQKLISSGATIVKNRRSSNFLIKGFVNFSPAYDMKTNIAITWLVTTENGRKLGKISQKTKIESDLADDQWRNVYHKIVANGISRIVKLINGFINNSRKTGIQIR